MAVCCHRDGTRHVVVTVLVLRVLFWLMATGDFRPRLRTAERHGVITGTRGLQLLSNLVTSLPTSVENFVAASYWTICADSTR
jgi:hypothetical protein